jgi:hypothetical protein
MRDYEPIPTRDRERTCWEMLRWFESPLYVREQIEGRHGTGLADVDAKAFRIASHAVQGREYFEAARNASLATQPTLLYYGMASFASAVALSSDPSAVLGKDHGVTLHEPGSWRDICDIGIRVKTPKKGSPVSGTLLDLLRTIPYEYYHTRYDVSRGRDLVAKVPRQVLLNPRQEISLGELLVQLPEVSTIANERYPGWLPKLVQIRHLDVQGVDGQGYRMVMGAEPEALDAVRRLCGEDPDSPRIAGQIATPWVPDPDELPLTHILFDSVGMWIYERVPYLLMPRLGVLTAAAFCFGFLARYRPERWTELTSGTSSHAVQVIRRFHRLAFDRFPMLALRELADRHYGMGPTWAQLRD